MTGSGRIFGVKVCSPCRHARFRRAEAWWQYRWTSSPSSGQYLYILVQLAKWPVFQWVVAVSMCVRICGISDLSRASIAPAWMQPRHARMARARRRGDREREDGSERLALGRHECSTSRPSARDAASSSTSSSRITVCKLRRVKTVGSCDGAAHGCHCVRVRCASDLVTASAPPASVRQALNHLTNIASPSASDTLGA